MRKQREEKDYWDEYEDFSLNSSSKNSDSSKSNLHQPNSDEKKEVIKNSKNKK